MTGLFVSRLLHPTTARARLTRRAATIAALGTLAVLSMLAVLLATGNSVSSDMGGTGATDPGTVKLCRRLGLIPPDSAQPDPTVSGWVWLTALAGVTAVVAVTSWFVLGSVLRPVEAARNRFAQLAPEASRRRVPLPRHDDEIAGLVQTMNTGLGRLQATVEQQRRFVADASHELRSPLAALQAELEIALTRPDRADWPEVVRAALGDTRRLQRLTEDLLLLARLDLDKPVERHRMEIVDLTDLVREEAARHRPAPNLALHLEVPEASLPVRGHPALLAQVLGNLLDNAERHATSSITVRLSHEPERRQAVLEVLDDGPGIPPADHARVFERFTRLDSARTRQTGGTGLGLAIARRITTLHHGTLTIAPTDRGARLTARLPASVGITERLPQATENG
ncbi:HAMP domain-containing sensor histidine kinase [Streptomyces sp. NPDC051597]|uniref:sensor histidine kinase n=1 Tax=Streptomyces sp. NPDC051597 TaxID=3155049 RepID=UPI00341DA692